MSGKVITQTEIRDAVILKQALEDIGLSYTQQGDIVQIQHLAYPITINLQTGQINYDSDHKSQINKLVKQYAVCFVKDEYIKRGIRISHQEVDTQGRIHIFAN